MAEEVLLMEITKHVFDRVKVLNVPSLGLNHLGGAPKDAHWAILVVSQASVR